MLFVFYLLLFPLMNTTCKSVSHKQRKTCKKIIELAFNIYIYISSQYEAVEIVEFH